MKKLTAGILTVMLGIVAANSADASIASKGYVDAQVGAKVSTTDFETFKGTNTTAIEAAQKAGTDASDALKAYQASNDAAVAKKADTETVNTELSKKQNTLTAADFVKDGTGNVVTGVTVGADGKIKYTTESVATSAELGTLQTTVADHTTKLGTLTGGADTTGSVANSIANALKDYTTTANMNTALEAKADKTTVATDLAKKQDKLTAGTNIEIGTDGTISSTYTYDDAAVKADIAKNANAISAMDTAYKAADTAINDKIGTVPADKTVVKMIEEAKTSATYDDTALKGRVDTIEKSTAYTSGITAAGVAQIETNKTGVADNKAAVAAVTKDLADNYTKTADLGTLAKAAPGECAEPTKKCALVFDGTAYTWEVIERDAENK